MALIFPINPVDGQLYPVPAQPGSLQYQWSAALKVWLIFSPLGVQSVTGVLPIVVNNGTDDAVVSILPATINTPGSMSAEDKLKLDNLPPDAANGTVTRITTGAGLSGGPITTTGQIELEPATTTTEGGVIVGNNIDVDAAGVISIPTQRFGVQSINLGPGLIGSPSPIVDTGTITAALATRLSVGSVRVGAGLQVAPDGTLSIQSDLAKVAVLAWASVQVVFNTSPPQFTLLEGYNVSSIVWAGTAAAPRVRINYQNPLVNADYGFTYGVGSRQTAGSAAYQQYSYILTSGFKSVDGIDLALSTVYTLDNRQIGGQIEFNKWTYMTGDNVLGPATFDILITDTPVLAP
jgi:hypothetical protein